VLFRPDRPVQPGLGESCADGTRSHDGLGCGPAMGYGNSLICPIILRVLVIGRLQTPLHQAGPIRSAGTTVGLFDLVRLGPAAPAMTANYAQPSS
jgi:hypothetical protein